MIDAADLKAEFRARYRTEPRLFAAPGRVNLIGEHTDYNDGFVFPLAIDRSTVVAAAPRPDRLVVIRSRSASGEVTIDLDRPGPPRRGVWFDYVEGVARALEDGGLALAGVDALVASDVPLGAGLSSSAALEIAAGWMLLALAGHAVDRTALARAAQAAEHAYVGTQCGIVDQLIAALAEPGHALLIDCRSLATRPVRLDAARALVMVTDSGVKHALASSAYNDRRAECEAAARALGVRALRDVPSSEIGKLGPRARHVVGENARTLAAADALAAGDVAAVGRLMDESHASLRDDYEVSAPELDLLVEAVRGVPGVFGARMTGGGFGGCTVTLVAPEAFPAARDAAIQRFSTAFGRAPHVFVTGAAGGASEIV